MSDHPQPEAGRPITTEQDDEIVVLIDRQGLVTYVASLVGPKPPESTVDLLAER